MKRFIAILLLMIFVVANSGAAITIHYCKGHLSKVELGSGIDKCSCKTKMVHHCCTSKTLVVKLKNNFLNATPSENNPVQPQIAVPVFTDFNGLTLNYSVISLFLQSDIAPPLIKDHTLLNRVFRI